MDMTHDGDDFWAQFDLDDTPVFETASDLARYSIQSHQGHNLLHRTVVSRGFLRLAGAGVHGHEANAASAFQVGLAFQKMITAIGSSINGAKKSISKSAETLTRLKLDGSPMPGSIIFNLVAEALPVNELRANGEIIDTKTQLVDRSFDALRQILTPADTMERQDALVQNLEALGPQAAVALRNFVTEAGDNFFDLELHWEQPLKPALHWEVPTADSRALKRFIIGQRLDEEPVQLNGTLHTVSLAKSWTIISQEFGRVTVDLGDLVTKINRSELPSGQWVQIEAMVSKRDSAGGKPKRTFRVMDIRPTDPPLPG